MSPKEREFRTRLAALMREFDAVFSLERRDNKIVTVVSFCPEVIPGEEFVLTTHIAWADNDIEPGEE